MWVGARGAINTRLREGCKWSAGVSLYCRPREGLGRGEGGIKGKKVMRGREGLLFCRSVNNKKGEMRVGA